MRLNGSHLPDGAICVLVADHVGDIPSAHWLQPRSLQLLPRAVSLFAYSSSNTTEPGARVHLCGYDLNFTYPQTEAFPTLTLPDALPGIFGPPGSSEKKKFPTVKQLLASDLTRRQLQLDLEEKRGLAATHIAKRDLSGRANGTIDPWFVHCCGICDLCPICSVAYRYGCFVYFEMTGKRRWILV
jgi:hypothetical protein